jgi:hypothetical protein
MGPMTKMVAVAASAFFLQAGAALADPAAPTGTDQTPKASDNACPKGMVEGPDGVCVQAKKGRMGFDLAAPGDNDNSSPSSNGNNNTRSVSGKSHGHH